MTVVDAASALSVSGDSEGLVRPFLAPGALPLHGTPGLGPVLAGVLVLASIASAVLVGLALAAFVRRRTSPYLFVALAVAALATRSVVGWLGMVGHLSTNAHHTAEHGLDVVMVALVVAAVWYAREIRTTNIV